MSKRVAKSCDIQTLGNNYNCSKMKKDRSWIFVCIERAKKLTHNIWGTVFIWFIEEMLWPFKN